MTLCANCSEELFSGKVCYKCGTRVGGLVGSPQSTAIPEPATQFQQAQPQPQPQYQPVSSFSTTTKSMSFTESIKFCLSNYANFKGRASRSEYWYFVLFGTLIYFVSALLLPELYVLAFLGLLIPTLAAAVRRLHDRGRSGWNMLWALVPLGGIVVFVWLVSAGEPAPNRFG